MISKEPKKTGLALGGGVVYGAAHIGVLRAIEENKIRVDHISGTSIGALVGTLYAFGFDWRQIRDITKDLRWLKIAAVKLSKYGLLSNRKLRDLVLKHIGDVHFTDANLPLSIMATNIDNGEKVVIESGRVAEAVMASTCIPGLFAPVIKEKAMLVDGGLVENVPVSPLQKAGLEHIIAVDLNAGMGIERPSSIIDIMLNSFELMLNSAAFMHTQQADIMICPDLSAFKRTDFDKMESMIDVGYESAMRAFNKEKEFQAITE